MTPNRCHCGIRKGMTYDTLRALAARSCTDPCYLCPKLDKALREAHRRSEAMLRVQRLKSTISRKGN